MRRRVALIINPAAGAARGRKRALAFARAVEDRGGKLTRMETRAPGHARDLAQAAAAGSDVVVSAGGDGTLNEVITGVRASGRSTPIALLPAGTANVVARELGLPSSIAALADVAMDGAVEKLHLGCANVAGRETRLFAMCCGVGVDGEIVEQVARGRGTEGISIFTYLPPVLRTLKRYSFPRLRVRVDGVEVEPGSENAPCFVLVARMQRYGGALRFFPPIARSDARLHVCCLRAAGAADLLLIGLRAYLHRLPGSSRARYFQGRSVEVETLAQAETPVQIDGEAAGRTPICLQTVEQPARLCAPRG